MARVALFTLGFLVATIIGLFAIHTNPYFVRKAFAYFVFVSAMITIFFTHRTFE